MEYLADELDVPLRRLPALQRELSPADDTKAVRELVAIIRTERPDVLHTHTAKAGGAGRVAALLARGGATGCRRAHVPRPRPARVLRSRQGDLLPPARAGARPLHRPVDRRQPRGARRPRLARRRTAVEVRGDPVRLRPRDAQRRDRHRTGPRPRGDRRERDDLRRRLGRAADGDQAAARPDPRAGGADRARGRCAALPRRRRPRATRRWSARRVARRRRPLSLRRLSEATRRVVRGVRRLLPDVGQRGHARRRDRGARRRAAGRRDARRRHAGGGRGRGERVSRGRGRHLDAVVAARRARARSGAPLATRAGRRRAHARAVREGAHGRRTSSASTATCSHDEGRPPDEGDGRRRRGAAPAQPAPGAAGARSRRAVRRARRRAH